MQFRRKRQSSKWIVNNNSALRSAHYFIKLGIFPSVIPTSYFYTKGNSLFKHLTVFNPTKVILRGT